MIFDLAKFQAYNAGYGQTWQWDGIISIQSIPFDPYLLPLIGQAL